MPYAISDAYAPFSKTSPLGAPVTPSLGAPVTRPLGAPVTGKFMSTMAFFLPLAIPCIPDTLL